MGVLSEPMKKIRLARTPTGTWMNWATVIPHSSIQQDEGRELAPKTGVHPPDNVTSALGMATGGDLAEECPKSDPDRISTCLNIRLEGPGHDVPFGMSKAEVKRIV
jgi:hypothetical protein